MVEIFLSCREVNTIYARRRIGSGRRGRSFMDKALKTKRFARFFLDKEKDVVVDLYLEDATLTYVLRTPNHGTGNLITNLAHLFDLPLSLHTDGNKIVTGTVPSYIDGYNRLVYIFRLGDTKVANIYPDGTVEMKAAIPAISKTLMSQTKDYRLPPKKTVIKSFIPSEYKFRTDLHTHMNAILHPDVLIALGIRHQIRYPLYYIKKLSLRCTDAQWAMLMRQRKTVEDSFADSLLRGKYLTRKIDDNTFINFADFILNNPDHAADNLARIRASLSILKDGQAVFTNLEKVYLYRYVFAKGVPCTERIPLTKEHVLAAAIPDHEINTYLLRMLEDSAHEVYRHNTVFQDKLLWIARSAKATGIDYLEISDTTLVKRTEAAQMLSLSHAVLPQVEKETGVTIRFLAAIRRIALTIVKDNIVTGDYFRDNLETLRAVAADPYVAGADIIGEEINDIRELRQVLKEIVRLAADIPSFVVRIHAGENDSLRDNVANSLSCVKEALLPGQPMPLIRIGHGLYTADLHSKKGKELIADLKESGAVLEFQITSNVRLNNLTNLSRHPLRHYLSAGVCCVQGTDGGAIYGTDMMDEQLALERFLDLTAKELCQMRRCEDRVRDTARRGYLEKLAAWEALAVEDVSSYYRQRIAEEKLDERTVFTDESKLPAKDVLLPVIRELPQDGLPVVVVGGSFNHDRRLTIVRRETTDIIDYILQTADPTAVFFVVGHRIQGYERYLIDQNRSVYGGKFRIFAMVPSMISAAEEKKLLRSGVFIRVSIEPSAMGLYKSFAYEIFKRRRSLMLALDGNSAGANMIQEAKNAKYICRTYVASHARILRTKARSIEGYVTVFSHPEDILAMIGKDLSEG